MLYLVSELPLHTALGSLHKALSLCMLIAERHYPCLLNDLGEAYFRETLALETLIWQTLFD